jgi:hypothetical protein
MGFAKFCREVDRFLPWLGEFKMALESGEAERSKRLRKLQHVLVELVRELDPDEVRFRGEHESGNGTQIGSGGRSSQ